MAAIADGNKILLAIEGGHRKTTEGWSVFLRSLHDRGQKCPKAVDGNGAMGLWAWLRKFYVDATELCCSNPDIVCRVLTTGQGGLCRLGAAGLL